ncbi:MULTISPECIES: DUF2563 family protein [Mycobacterium]|uniref:DUF2563 family protein n=1 Tax=Mycobacterium servetii TaxID=3237418 RepID=A0ABV4C8A5_9MYCO
MFVDPGLLRLGANESHRAGGHARDGADHLARGPLAAGMFGDFAAAETFHEALSAAHAEQLRSLQVHYEALSAVGSKAAYAAAEFTGMDERGAEQLRAVRDKSVS